MKAIIMKILKGILLVTLLLIVVCLLIWGSLYLEKPWWTGPMVLADLCFLYLAFLLIKKFWNKYGKDENALKNKKVSNNLNVHFKDNVKKIKPYVVPWYMIIGESGSGKTTAISNTNISSTFDTPTDISEISETTNFDFRFLENAIIIDTAGRYAIKSDKIGDKSEWISFLKLVAKYRKKEPIHGLIVTISADKLLESTSDLIEKHGISIRGSIQEVMERLGKRFPVYILVTKCDLIQGMTEFCEYLPENKLNQAMGYLNNDNSTDVDIFLNKAIDKVTQQLKKLRTLISYTNGFNTSPAPFFFPEEFAKLKHGIQTFFNTAFKKNVYEHETTVLKGIYFTSARQTGTSLSHLINNSNIEITSKLPDTNKSIFISDFFSKILHEGKELIADTFTIDKKKRLVRNIGIGVWIAFIICLSVLLSSSFAKNRSIIKQAKYQLANPPQLSGKLETSLNAMEELRKVAIEVEEQNNSGWISNLGLNQSVEIEDKLKTMYYSLFKNKLLSLYDREMGDRVINFYKKTPHQIIAQNIPHIVKRINILTNCIQGKDIEQLAQSPQPDYRYLIADSDEKIIPKFLELFEIQYLYYISWAKKNILIKEKKDLQEKLKYIVTKKDISLNWLTTWCDIYSNINQISFKDFWEGTGTAEKELVIPPSYTVEGKKYIELFIQELESALPNPFAITKKKSDFINGYKVSYIASWFQFGIGFPEGATTLSTRDEMASVAMKMGTEQGPYLYLLDRMLQELEPFINEESEENNSLPGWIKLIIRFDAVKMKALEEPSAKKKIGIIDKITNKGKKLLTKASIIENDQSLIISANAFNDYKKGLSGTRQGLDSSFSAFEMTSKAFQEEPATGESHIFFAQRGFDKLKNSITDLSSSSFSLQEKMFFKLLSGPIEYLWNFASRETSCYLQKAWQESVLSKIYGIDNKKLLDILLGENGHATIFLNTVLKPFIRKNSSGKFYAKRVSGERIPFSGKFLTFLTKGDIVSKIVEDSYKITLQARPTDVNPGAKLPPHLTTIELECADGLQILENRNYPVSKTFVWSPENCGAVYLKIYVGNLSLVKKYTGHRPFAKFLKDFESGFHTFNKNDFKDDIDGLKRLGIEHIKVSYKFTGNEPVIELLDTTPEKAPGLMVRCALKYCRDNLYCVY